MPNYQYTSTLVTTVGSVPNVTRQKMAIGAGHRVSFRV